MEHVVVAEGPREAGIHEVAEERRRGAAGERLDGGDQGRGRRGGSVAESPAGGRGQGRRRRHRGQRRRGERGSRQRHGSPQRGGPSLRLFGSGAGTGRHLLELGRGLRLLAELVVAVGEVEEHLVRRHSAALSLGRLVALLEELTGARRVTAAERGARPVAERLGAARGRRWLLGVVLCRRRRGQRGRGEGEGTEGREEDPHEGNTLALGRRSHEASLILRRCR